MLKSEIFHGFAALQIDFLTCYIDITSITLAINLINIKTEIAIQPDATDIKFGGTPFFVRSLLADICLV